ncbi:MAG: 5-formyltetrahydrofolate cyclo-ligase [Candidatus Ruminococcus intestinipullorum]|nr:5-formyltetrahydrofolate cyclo-ligase [Candidatus Ruminococcus intestinipullorum]
MDIKKDIRSRILQKRQALTEEERTCFSDMILQKVISHPWYQMADTIYCYASFSSEVSTNQIISHAWKSGKRVALPKVVGSRKMEFYYIQGFEDLNYGFRGILEPSTSQRAFAEHGLMLMPGAVFDPYCGRIGYGGGFYDAYLGEHNSINTIALAFQVQIVEHIPMEEHDIRPQIVLTEKESYSC